MNTLGMMERVAFGTLDNITQPLRRSDIRVLEDAEEIRYKNHHRNGLGCKSCDQAETNTAQGYPSQHIEWAEVESAVCVQSLGAVVHLVERLPKEVAFV